MINEIARFKNADLLTSDPTKDSMTFSNGLLAINDNNKKTNYIQTNVTNFPNVLEGFEITIINALANEVTLYIDFTHNETGVIVSETLTITDFFVNPTF